MNKIYFINSARFNYAEIDLRKGNIFFVGDNGSGKTTAIRAIHYYYNSDVKSLGIDPNKRSFKDFYFQYPNSYIVYQFDKYFVIMYKSSGDIKKAIIEGEFRVDDLVKNENVVEYREMLQIYKPNRVALIHRNEDFKQIIYGMDVKKEEFRVTTIKNYETFIRLYNKIFNVNKAVFDVDSIKEIIKTSLDRDTAGEIDYDEFFNKIKEYKNYFNFYSRFKRNEKRIDDVKELKAKLLNLDKEIKIILAKISYRKSIEEDKLKDVIEKIKDLEKRIEKFVSVKSHLEKKAKKCERNIERIIFELQRDIDEINRLKNYFTLERVNSAKRKASLYEEYQDELSKVISQIQELEANIKDLVAVIEDEIKELKRKKRNLENERKEKEILAYRELEEVFEEKFKSLKDEYRKKEIELEEKESRLKKEIEIANKKLESLQTEKEKVIKKFKAKENEIIKKYEDEENRIKKEIKSLKRQIEENEDEIYKLNREIKKAKDELEEKLIELKENFLKEKGEIKKRVEFFESILETKKDSFKEFLNENVPNWEVELYPVIDEDLLSMDVTDLEPKIKSGEVFGIELNKSKLKSIPTMQEAEEAIKDLNTKLKVLEDKFRENEFILNKEFEELEIKKRSEIEVLKENNDRIKEKIIEFRSKINATKEKEKEELDKLRIKQNEEVKLIEANLKKQKDLINTLNKEKKEIVSLYKILEKELKTKQNELNKEKTLEKEKIKKELNLWLNEEKKKIDLDIVKKEEEKLNATKDEKLKELRNKERGIKEKLNESLKAGQFLKEYEEKLSFIESLDELKEKLNYYSKREKSFLEFKENLLNKIEKRLEDFTNEKKELNKIKEKIKKGINKAKDIPNVEDKVETNEFLDDLVVAYKDNIKEFSYKKANFIDTLGVVKRDLERFVIEGLDVNFVFELIDTLDSNELKKIDELIIFKEKKFETHNKTMVENLRNLIKGILDREIQNFEDAKEDFLSQIKRVNRNLSKVDFGVIKEIKLEFDEAKRDILKLFEEIKEKVTDLIEILDNEKSLFFDKRASKKLIEEIEVLFERIKNEINKESFSLADVVDITLEFNENGEVKKGVRIIKNESSTGGSILLKIAIAVSLLELFLKEKANLFLILDEVSVISAKNQKLLRDYVNERGLGVIYVTPDLPVLGDVEEIDIYKFRSTNGEFEVIRLISEEGIKFEMGS